MIKRSPTILIALLSVLFSIKTFSQGIDLEVSKTSKTCLKVGFNAEIPISETSDYRKFILGLDASIQYMPTKAYGFGMKTGYLNYLGKDNIKNMEVIPLAVLFRSYPKSSGIFVGIEAGYAIILQELASNFGGIYIRPHFGWHTDRWNFFAYYNYINRDKIIFDIHPFFHDLNSIGLGVSYDIYLK